MPPWRKLVSAVLWATLLLVSTVLFLVLWADPYYLADGAWRGYYDQPGEPSPTEEDDGALWLLDEAGERTFDVTEADLDLDSLRTWGGRFSPLALSEPVYEEGDPETLWAMSPGPDGRLNRAILVDIGGDVRVIPLGSIGETLILNDVVGGVPIVVVISQRIGFYGVFERRYGNAVHTFGSSGYLYYENGVWDGNFGIVLWDAESKSLWWPPKGVAVAGALTGTPLKVLDPELWCHITMPQVIETYERIKVIRDGRMAIEPEHAGSPGPFSSHNEADWESQPLLARWGENPPDKLPSQSGDPD